MTLSGKGLRRALVGPLAVLLLAPGVAIPILDRADFEHTLAIEGPGHDPAHCPPGHDHDLCMQLRANHPAPTLGAAYLHPGAVIRLALPQTPRATSPRPVRGTYRPRAPPTA